VISVASRIVRVRERGCAYIEHALSLNGMRPFGVKLCGLSLKRTISYHLERAVTISVAVKL
jgi:hypothetical protein